MKSLFLISISLFLVSCGTREPIIIDPDHEVFLHEGETYVEDVKEYKIDITEDKTQQGFNIEFSSLSDENMCLLFGEWPFEQEWQGNFNRVKLEVNNQLFHYLKIDNIKVCTWSNPRGLNNCRHHIKAGNKLKGFLSYKWFEKEAFSDPNAKKKLHLPIRPIYCPATSQ